MSTQGWAEHGSGALIAPADKSQKGAPNSDSDATGTSVWERDSHSRLGIATPIYRAGLPGLRALHSDRRRRSPDSKARSGTRQRPPPVDDVAQNAPGRARIFAKRQGPITEWAQAAALMLQEALPQPGEQGAAGQRPLAAHQR